MRGLVPRIHVCGQESKAWVAGTIPGSSPGTAMTDAANSPSCAGLSRASTSVGRKQDVGGRDNPRIKSGDGHDGCGEFTVMRGLVPRIHVCGRESKTWVAG